MKSRFVLGMVRREMRAAARRFGFYGGCMAIGIAVVVCLYSLRSAVNEAVDLRSKELLGADLRLESRDAFSALGAPDLGGPELAKAIEALEERAGVAPSRVTRLGSMALAEKSGRSRLVDLLAIEGEYPLYGEVWTKPFGRWSEFGKQAGKVFVDSTLLVQIDIAVGDSLRIGSQQFEVAGAVTKAPGSFGMQAEVAPRVFLMKSDLDRTGLLQEGSMVSHLRYYPLPSDFVDGWVSRNETLLAEARVRTQTVSGYQEDMSEAFGSLTRYLGLVGLAALVLGSIGVAAGVRVFIREKMQSVALLRSIGASPGDVVAIYTGLAIALGLAAGALGILLCIPLLWVVPGLFAGLLPVEVELGVGPGAIATGLGLSVWATLLCAMGPVFDLAAVPPLRALRQDFSPAGGAGANRARRGRWLSIAAVVISLLLASVWQAGDLRVGLFFAGGLVLTVGVLAVSALGLIRLLRSAPPRRFSYAARQGIANLFRPRNHTLPTTIAIGFALFVVATIQIVQKNVIEQMAVDNRPDRPNFVLFDVQRDQVDGVESLLDEYDAAVTDRAPLISARLSGIKGTSRSDYLADGELAEGLRWALQREYRLTYHDTLRDTEELVEGEWWPPGATFAAGEPFPVSLERDLAESLGVGVGDALRWRIQGVEVDTKVTSLRQVDWGRMATNFFVVFPPAALSQAPQSTVLLAYLGEEEARASMQRDLVGQFPNVSALDATLILRSMDSMFEQIGVAIRILALFTMGTGIAILIAASMAARSERAREAVLLRVLGASRSVLQRIVATEAVVLAALAAGVGGLLSLVAGWAVVVFVFDLPFAPPLLDVAALALATFGVTALFGGLGGASGASGSPQEALRGHLAG
ncbi:MAG: ABC transporter permease [Myxococcota bacterium]